MRKIPKEAFEVGELIDEFTDLCAGMYVVHKDHVEDFETSDIFKIQWAGPRRDPQIVLIDENGHSHFIAVENEYHVVKINNVTPKYRIAYGNHFGTILVTDKFYYGEHEFIREHGETYDLVQKLDFTKAYED